MSEFKPTDSQRAAIETRGRAILVSAAAGSGKTKVLTERLVSRISDDADIDSFLVITFTKAAAAELRGRIAEEIGERLASDPDNRRLRRQSALCQRAQIGTIHSFCAAFLRENCHAAGLSPEFRVIEETRAEALKHRIIERVMDEAYEKADSDFMLLADSVGRGRNDSRLSELVISLHEKMQSHERPEKWARAQVDSLCGSVSDPAETPWGKEILSALKDSAEYMSECMDALCRKAEQCTKIYAAYGGSLAATAESLRDFSRALDSGWDRARAFLPIEYPKFNALRNSPDPELSEHISAVRKACKKETDKYPALLAQSGDKVLADLRLTAPAIRALVELTLKFDREFSAEKRRRSEVDFSDLEHMTVALLTEEDGSPTPLARDYSSRFTEIMVDEYQDVNRVQDSIFRAISKDGTNLFMVGDIKQSIYRFRLAEPGIFAEKYESFSDLNSKRGNKPVRIMLQENFRSRREIISAANHVFKTCMSKKLGEVDYDSKAQLKYGASYEGSVPVPELMLIDCTGDDIDDSPDRKSTEARAVADKIFELMHSGTLVNDKGVMRPLRYSDIAVMTRAAKSVVNTFSTVLSEAGIPVLSGQGEGFFSSPEISSLVCLLAVIDNPHQDIPLISALLSPAFGFSADELSDIRATDKSCDFWTALLKKSETDEKCADFAAKINSFREYSKILGSAELIRHIFNELDLIAVYSATPGGEARCARLSRMTELALSFESGGFKGLRRFVEWLRKLAEKGIDELGGTGNAVQILTIHKSKGLEFPVVFLCDTSHQFNQSDNRDPVLIHPELGFGTSVTDSVRGIEYPTIANTAIKLRAKREMLSDEMRLLYVALTRAKERLFITAAIKNPEEKLASLSASTLYPVSPESLMGASSMSVWLMQALLSCRDGSLSLSVCRPGKASQGEAETETDKVCEPDPETVSELREKLSFRYQHEAASLLPSKLTATELKKYEEPDSEASSLVPVHRQSFRKPVLAEKSTKLTAAEKGIAAHTLLQFMDYGKTRSLAEIKSEIARLCASNHLSEAQAAAVDAGVILKLFSSELGRRIANADKVLREFKFSLLCPADRFFEGGNGENVLLQGVIDCCIEEDGLLTVIDYKTDSVRGDAVSERAKSYEGQLKAYTYALEKMTGKRVKECVLYFIRAGETVYLKK